MKLLLIIINFIIFITNCAIAQPGLNKIYGTLTSTGFTVIPELNGYFIAGVGYSEQFALWNAIKLYRVDSLGNEIWEKEFGKTSLAYYTGHGGSTKRINGEDFIIPGCFSDSETNVFSAFVLRIDSLGDTIWTHSFTLGSYTQFNDCILSDDNGIVLVGYSNGLGDTNGDVFIVKLDSSGKLLWQKKYGGDQDDDGLHIGLMPDGGFIISGFTYGRFGN